MNNTRQEILTARGAFRCVECGKCVALCPMAETAAAFSRLISPRGAVQQALRGTDVTDMPALVSCLQCRSCSQTCPAGVDVAGLIADLRQLLPQPVRICCPACGTPLLPADAQAYLSRAANAGFESELSYASLCPSCRRRAYARNNR